MSNEKNKPVVKVFSIICTVLTAIILALTAVIIVNMIVCRAQNKPVSFFGTSFAIVQTNSMEPEIKVGDLIVFVAGEGFDEAIKGQSVVHEAIAITENGITTKGVNNPSADRARVTADNLLGICTFNSAGWGAFSTFLSKYGIIFIIALIAIPFIVSQIIKIVKLSKQREEEKKAETAIQQTEPDLKESPLADDSQEDTWDDPKE